MFDSEVLLPWPPAIAVVTDHSLLVAPWPHRAVVNQLSVAVELLGFTVIFLLHYLYHMTLLTAYISCASIVQLLLRLVAAHLLVALVTLLRGC